MAYRDTVKAWFIRRTKPTQEQFSQLFDYLRFNDEEIPMNKITELVTVLQGKADQSALAAIKPSRVQEIAFDADGFYSLDAGWLLECIIVETLTDAEFKLGSQAGLDDIFPAITIKANKPQVITLNKFDVIASLLFFGGVPVGTKVFFVSRQIITQ